MKRVGLIALAVLVVGIAGLVAAHAAGLGALDVRPDGHGGDTYTVPVQAILFLGALAFLPAMLIAMTSFTRIVIVLALLRQALGLTQTPPNLVLVGLALFLTAFVMGPVWQRIDTVAVAPLTAGHISVEQAAQKAEKPLKAFMLRQTRKDDLALFVHLSGGKKYPTASDVPFGTVVPAFLTSELKTAFYIGFVMYLPFVVIDIVVASVMMSLGMMLLSPVTVSLPLKLLLFVAVGGWDLVMGSLARGFVH